MCNSCGHIIITLDFTSLLDSRQENWSPDILYKVKDTFSIYLFTFAENKLMKCPISLSLSNDLCVCVFFFLGLFEKWREVFFFLTKAIREMVYIGLCLDNEPQRKFSAKIRQ